jgi:hypothetical protein
MIDFKRSQFEREIILWGVRISHHCQTQVGLVPERTHNLRTLLASHRLLKGT